MGLGCAVATLAAIAFWSAVTRRHHSAARWCLVLSLAGTALLVVTLIEAHATPPFGDEPPPSFTWGAVVGVLAPIVSTIGGWSAFLVVRNADRTSLKTVSRSVPSIQ